MNIFPSIITIKCSTILTSVLLLCLSSVSHAENGLPVDFSYKDWELVCDNTRTCRAVGYQDDYSDSKPVALMLKRNAGANQRVRAYVKFSEELYESENQTCPNQPKQNDNDSAVMLTINGKSYGEVSIVNDEKDIGGALELTERQVHALINTLPTSSQITFTKACDEFVVSDKGSTAILLKMDEVQGRIGTKGAIVKRGNKPEKFVLSALPKPRIKTIKLNDMKLIEKSKAMGDEAKFAKLAEHMPALIEPTFRNNDKANSDCYLLSEEPTEYSLSDRQWIFQRLNDDQILAEHICWMGAYNVGYGFWLLTDKAKTQQPQDYQVEFITASGSEYDRGEIYGGHKGRGIGDCWSFEHWQWTGKRFVKTQAYHTGMCKGVVLGGAFELPTFVSEVIE